MVWPVSQGGLSESWDRKNNIITSDYFLCYFITPHIRNILLLQKTMSGCKVCISKNSMHVYLIDWRQKQWKFLDLNSSGHHRLRSVDICGIILSRYWNEVMAGIKYFIRRQEMMHMPQYVHFPFRIRAYHIGSVL